MRRINSPLASNWYVRVHPLELIPWKLKMRRVNADFIHKIKIAAKEADETQYWISLCEFSSGYPDTNLIANKLTELQKIINAILGTTKRNSM